MVPVLILLKYQYSILLGDTPRSNSHLLGAYLQVPAHLSTQMHRRARALPLCLHTKFSPPSGSSLLVRPWQNIKGKNPAKKYFICQSKPQHMISGRLISYSDHRESATESLHFCDKQIKIGELYLAMTSLAEAAPADTQSLDSGQRWSLQPLLRHAKRSHSRMPGIRKIPLRAIAIIVLIAVLNIIAWVAAAIVLVCSLIFVDHRIRGAQH